MIGTIDTLEIEIPCERCRRKTKKSVGWIKRNSEYTCACGTVVALDAGEFKREIAKIEHELLKLSVMFK